MFFFEKKNQKTFMAWFEPSHEVFLLLFFLKKKTLIPTA